MPPTSIDSSAAIAIPWGDAGRITLELPPAWPAADVVWPDLAGAIEDYPGALGAALDALEGGGRIEGQVRAGSTVAIVVDDPSRWTPVREAVPIVLERLHAAGVRPSDVTFSVGVGRHHAVDAVAMRQRLGDAVVDAYPCFSPPVDDLSAYVDLGIDAGGGAGAGLPPGGRGGLSHPDRVGAPAPPGGVRRRLQADLPGDEPPLDAGGPASPGARGGRRPPARRRGAREPDAPGDPVGGRAAGALRLDQPPDRGARADPPRRGGASRPGAGPARARGPPPLPGARGAGRPT